MNPRVNWHSGWRRNVLIQTGTPNGAANGVEFGGIEGLAVGENVEAVVRVGAATGESAEDLDELG